MINSLISPNPDDRPSAATLLKEKLSLEIEEDILKSTLDCVNPGTKKYQLIIDKVFNTTTTARYVPFNQRGYDDKASELREVVIKSIERVFRLHGAKKIETPFFERSINTGSLTVNI